MNKKTVLIISEHPADFNALTAALERAQPARFLSLTANTRDQPVEALMDPANDAVILAYTLETEYLFRLAQKKNLTLPIIVLIDQETEPQIGKLKDAGASDYIVRDLTSDDMLYRILDESIARGDVTLQHQQLLQQQRVEHIAQHPGDHLRGVAEAGAGGEVCPAFTAPPAHSRGAAEEQQSEIPAPAAGWSRALVSPWKVTIVALIAALLLLSAGLLSQRLDSESRLSRLEASNEFLSRQVLQIHSDLTRAALAGASPGPPLALPVPVATPQKVPTPTAVVKDAGPVVVQPQPALPATRVPASVQAETVAPAAWPAAHSELASVEPITPVPGIENARWFINLGTFSSRNAARRFANSLGPSSRRLEIQPLRMAGKNLYRVRLVKLPSAEVAEALAVDYQISLGGSRPWVGRD